MVIAKTPGGTIIDLSGDIRRRRRERLVKAVFFAAATFSILISLAIVLALVGKASSFVSSIELNQLWADGWFPRRGRFQLPALLVHSLIITGIAMLVAVPFGLGSAVYLSEYARSGVRRVLKPTLEILAGIPSVVLGFFALQFISPNIVRGLFPGAQSANLLSAGIAVGILTVPLVASVAEDAMRAVPLSLREASYGLGAKRWHTALRVVFPAAISGIIAAMILGISRAVGETMVVALAAGLNGILNLNPIEGGLTMTGAMANLAVGSDQVAGDVSAFQSLFFVGLVLFALTLGLNVMSERLVRRYRQRY
ncbi:MAG TPA: phosphate ABC transporter permease subunit PstC [Acidimicrobiia bacterium]|nr:phosphate ABC transporter permease subunit PstC [Acidimicrobiia bacterium]